MALVHNMVFRSFNSIWVQAPYVRDEDKLDFVNYALAWYHFVKHHHDDEEAELFPKVEELLKDKVFKVDHEEHGESLLLFFTKPTAANLGRHRWK